MASTPKLASPVSQNAQTDAEKESPKNIYIAKSFDISVIDWIHVLGLYASWIFTALFIVAIAILIPSEVRTQPTEIVNVFKAVGSHMHAQWFAYAIFVSCVFWFLSKKPSVYLLDFAVYEPPEDWKLSHKQIVEVLKGHQCFDDESLSFMSRMLERSGTGEATAWPPMVCKLINDNPTPCKNAPPYPIALTANGVPDCSAFAARTMADEVMFSCVEKALKQTGVKGKEIDFLIVNCSLFCPTPSLCSSVMKRFGLRSDCKTYNLGGMGCSAGVISVDLAKQLLQNSPNSYALIVSFEDITQALYRGNERSMLLQNTLFRVGGAAIILSNKPIDGFRAKYKLLHSVRVQETSDSAWNCVMQKEDVNGKKGIELTKDITTIAGKALEKNLTMLGPRVLPLSEQAKVVVSLISKSAAKFIDKIADSLHIKQLPFINRDRIGKVSMYVPDFKKGVQHFCIHAGGRAVIDGIEQNLKLSPHHVAPSRATLRNQGNTSSSSVWYELKYVEQDEARYTELVMKEGGGRPIRSGERVLQIAFGAGFKCNSAVWLRLK